MSTYDLEKLAFTRGDRMRRAMKVAGLSVQDMADYLRVDRATVSTWINDRHAPAVASLMLWAARTGAPLEWITTGDLPGQEQDRPGRPVALSVVRRPA